MLVSCLGLLCEHYLDGFKIELMSISSLLQVEDAQGREAPIQRLADSIAGPFVDTVMTLSAATFAFW